MSNATMNIFKYDIEHKIIEYINSPIMKTFTKLMWKLPKVKKKNNKIMST